VEAAVSSSAMGSGGEGGWPEDCDGSVDRDANGLATSEENWNMPIELR
jgi:hypothetical protein